MKVLHRGRAYRQQALSISANQHSILLIKIIITNNINNNYTVIIIITTKSLSESNQGVLRNDMNTITGNSVQQSLDVMLGKSDGQF